jgi:hypothetical protein
MDKLRLSHIYSTSEPLSMAHHSIRMGEKDASSFLQHPDMLLLAIGWLEDTSVHSGNGSTYCGVPRGTNFNRYSCLA